jgi:hypothetical protein
MSTETLEVVKICEALPAQKRAEVADFARFLLGRTTPNFGLSASQLNLVSRKLHAKAQKARQQGTAQKESLRPFSRVGSNPDIKPLGISR